MAFVDYDRKHDDFAQRSSDFVAWFRNSPGTRLNRIVQLADLRNRGAGRGAVASEDIQPDEELFAIPRNLVLTASTSSVPPEVLEPLQDTGSWSPLIISIISEYLKSEKSTWHPYFRVLPTSFDSLMFWNEAELAELQASAVVNKIGKATAEESWQQTIIPLMLKHGDLFPVQGDDEAAKTRELIRLAHFAGSLIMAYAFDIDRDDGEKRRDDSGSEDDLEEDDENEPLKGMVPFADMLNADADRNNARLIQEDDFLIMKATKPIKAGEEIFNDYGPLPRSDLLRMYGYVTKNYAQYDVVEFEHDLLVDVAGMRDANRNKAWLRREEALDEIGIIDDGYSIPRPSKGAKLDEYLPGNIHMLLRGMCLDATTTKMPKMNYQDSVSITEAALLSTVATKMLSEYSTSLEQDKELLREMKDSAGNWSKLNVPTKRYRMAIQVRAGEKEILHDIIKLCQSHIAEKTNQNADEGKKRKIQHSDEPTTSKKRTRKP